MRQFSSLHQLESSFTFSVHQHEKPNRIDKTKHRENEEPDK
jgi:hypothetical protein